MLESGDLAAFFVDELVRTGLPVVLALSPGDRGALAVVDKADGFVFADDSGLAVDALHGAPGIYSARYAGKAASDADNNALVLANLTGVANRSARQP